MVGPRGGPATPNVHGPRNRRGRQRLISPASLQAVLLDAPVHPLPLDLHDLGVVDLAGLDRGGRVLGFQGDAAFPAEVSRFVAWVKSSATAAPGGEILVPGEFGQRTKAHRLREGIDV